MARRHAQVHRLHMDDPSPDCGSRPAGL